MTPDTILGDTPETTGIPSTGPERTDDPGSEEVREDASTSETRVKYYDGLRVELGPDKTAETIGSDANGA